MMNLPAMSPEALVYGLVWSHSLQSLFALAIGFALAGAIANGYQMLMLQPASFGLLEQADRSRALAAVPFLVFAAPFLIMRYAVQGDRERRRGRFGFVTIATVLAGLWSLMSGTVVMSMLGALGVVAV